MEVASKSVAEIMNMENLLAHAEGILMGNPV
jgi:hypothetical protein